MLDFDHRVEYAKDYIFEHCTDNEIIRESVTRKHYINFEDNEKDITFIKFINELFFKWYNVENKNINLSELTTEDHYRLFISNGIYKLIIPKIVLFDVDMFDESFYKLLLSEYPSYALWFIHHVVNITKMIYEKQQPDIMNDDINDFVNCCDNVYHVLIFLDYVHSFNSEYKYCSFDIKMYIKTLTLYFILSQKYSTQLFDYATVVSPLIRYGKRINGKCLYDYLYDKLGYKPETDFTPMWILTKTDIMYKHIAEQDNNNKYHGNIIRDISFDMFMNNVTLLKQHLKGYITDVLEYKPNTSYIDLITNYYIKFSNYRYLPDIDIPSKYIDEEIKQYLTIYNNYKNIIEKYEHSSYLYHSNGERLSMREELKIIIEKLKPEGESIE